MKIRVVLICLLLIMGCATPPHEMMNDNSSSVAINASFTYLPVPFLSLEDQYWSPDLVYFVKINGDESNLLSQTQILVSNYYNDYGAFILNAEPGKYVAIAAHYKSKHSNKTKDYIIMFPKNVVQSSMIEVQTGSFEYMGHVKLDQQPIFKLSNKADNFDEVQSYFYELLVPFQLPSVVSFLLTNVSYSNATFVSFNKNKDEFIKNQEKYFKDTKWQSKMIQK